MNETLLEICFNYELNDEVSELLELPSVPDRTEIPIAPVGSTRRRSEEVFIDFSFKLIVPMENLTLSKKSKTHDCYEELAQEIRSLTVNNIDSERKVRLSFIPHSIKPNISLSEH